MKDILSLLSLPFVLALYLALLIGMLVLYTVALPIMVVLFLCGANVKITTKRKNDD